MCAIEELKDTDQMSVDELQSSLMVHEQKFKKSIVEEQALKTTMEERKEGRVWKRKRICERQWKRQGKAA